MKSKISFITFFILALFHTPMFETSGSVPYIFGTSLILTTAFLISFIKGKYSVKKHDLINLAVVSSPYLFAIFFSLFETQNSSLFRSFLTIAYWLIAVCIAYCTVLFVEVRSVELNFKASIVVFFIHVIVTTFNIGIKQTFTRIFDLSNPLELHSLSFALGIFFIYFLTEPVSRKKVKILTTSFFIFLAFKRIEIVALISCLAVFFLKKTWTKSEAKGFFLLLFLIACIYAACIFNGIFSKIIEHFNLETTGRVEVYELVVSNIQHKASWLGLGLGWIIENLNSMERNWRGYSDLHCDILKFFLELGIIGGLIFWFLWLYVLPKFALSKIFSKHILLLVLLILYNFILFLTDNTIRYLLVNIAFYQILFLKMKQFGNNVKKV